MVVQQERSPSNGARLAPARPKRRTPRGSAPGTFVPDPRAAKSRIQFIGYNADELVETTIEDIDDVAALEREWHIAWVNVDGVGSIDLIEKLGARFGLHQLALEDVINVHQRPKVEEYDDHLFIVTRMLLSDRAPESEQIALFLARGFVLTFQEQPGDCFDPIRQRLRHHRGILRQMDADYLAYALLDAVIDGYFPVLEDYGERLDRLEAATLSSAQDHAVARIYEIKRDLLAVRRCIWPQREMLNTLIRDENPFIAPQTRIYLRDCYDHAVQLMDMIETDREIASSLVDLHLAGVNTRMNEVMKVLTIIATIFIPLGFIASVFGMNFDRASSPWNMPELGWYWGYPSVLLLMALVAIAMVAYFVRSGWIGRRRSRRRKRR